MFLMGNHGKIIVRRSGKQFFSRFFGRFRRWDGYSSLRREILQDLAIFRLSGTSGGRVMTKNVIGKFSKMMERTRIA